MKKVDLTRELDYKIKNIAWTYEFFNENLIEFTNIKIENKDEQDFLDKLKKEGSELIIDNHGDFSTSIVRLEDKLLLGIIDKNSNLKTERKEISEKKALKIFRESKKDPSSLSEIFKIFGKNEPEHKEFVPNRFLIEFDFIKNIDLKNTGNLNILDIHCKNYHFKLREDGGLQITPC